MVEKTGLSKDGRRLAARTAAIHPGPATVPGLSFVAGAVRLRTLKANRPGQAHKPSCAILRMPLHNRGAGLASR